MDKKKGEPIQTLPDDTLPQQIVEDEDGNMRVVPAEWLQTDAPRPNPLIETQLGMDNMEKDLPDADVQAYGSLEDYL